VTEEAAVERAIAAGVERFDHLDSAAHPAMSCRYFCTTT
jgi:hypothetical protein